jgi:hypothetical protein
MRLIGVTAIDSDLSPFDILVAGITAERGPESDQLAIKLRAHSDVLSKQPREMPTGEACCVREPLNRHLAASLANRRGYSWDIERHLSLSACPDLMV